MKPEQARAIAADPTEHDLARLEAAAVALLDQEDEPDEADYDMIDELILRASRIGLKVDA